VNEGTERVTLTVHHDGEVLVLHVPAGANLRLALLDAGLSPYTRLTERLNCGGRGICATCGVRLRPPRAPDHWHDALAARFGYPRLSCQLTVERDAVVKLPDKVVWGGREVD
jgi:ferredoxin